MKFRWSRCAAGDAEHTQLKQHSASTGRLVSRWKIRRKNSSWKISISQFFSKVSAQISATAAHACLECLLGHNLCVLRPGVWQLAQKLVVCFLHSLGLGISSDRQIHLSVQQATKVMKAVYLRKRPATKFHFTRSSRFAITLYHEYYTFWDI